MKQYLFLFLLISIILISLPVSAQKEKPKTHTISGRVTDSQNGESLIGATIYVSEMKTGAVSDIYGNYSVTLPVGQYTVVISYIGYSTVQKTITLDKDVTLKVELSVRQENLKEVEISSERNNKNVLRPEMSTFKMDIKTIETIPALFGEVDIIKAIQLLPGVQSVSEGSSGFSVRGGAPDQNLILLDGANVYNASHMLGFFSVFNNDAIKDVKLYKGDIPPAYGGRLSSVLDIHMEEGNSKKLEINGGIGLISSRLTIEAPILKDRCSFIVSGRRTYADLYLPLSSNKALQNNKLYFYDLNAKINYKFGDKDQIFLSGYFGRDVFKNQFAGMQWGNGTGTLRWNHLFTKKLFGNFSAVYSDYRYRIDGGSGSESDVTAFQWNASLKDIGVKGDFSYFANTKNTIKFGVSATYHIIDPGVAKGTGSSVFNEISVQHNYALETGLYAGNEERLGDYFTLKYGLRFSMFQNVGPDTVFQYDANYNTSGNTAYNSGTFYHTYYGLEPRVGLLFSVNDKSSVKASYSRTNQYMQLAQNSTVGTPLDIWFPASPNVKPQISDQVALGYFRNFRRNTIETSCEVYYKWMQHVIDFKDYAVLLLNDTLEGQLRIGKAWSYGAEFLVRLNEKKLNGWVSYTYSRVFRQVAEINNGNFYPAPYDKPHNVAIVLNYRISKRFLVSANWVYSTGNPLTFPIGRAEIGGKIFPIYSDRNAYRYQAYHRLDLSMTFYSKQKPGRKFAWDLNASIYNVYNRHNTWSIEFVQDKVNPNVTSAERVYLFGIIPSVTFNFHFNNE
ncbi:MAG: TonB-dependent receptor [Bacteroidetes bacterium]|nr:TonB-dependent receptor [Bacteroidota bacterium]